MNRRRPLPPTWRAKERKLPTGAFESVQSVLLPAPVVDQTAAGGRRLGERYWRELRRSTFGLVRARTRLGTRELRLLGVRPALLVFGAPDVVVGHGSVTCAYPIRGGLLARSACGSISFGQTGTESVELRSEIRGFFPRLAGWSVLYRCQARLHAALARRYFTTLWREAAE
jgi:hypothetical protein